MSKIQANNTGIERRCFSSEVRAIKQDDKDVVRGYAAKFNVLSENLGGFREKIAPGFFDDILDDDVRALMNHDNNFVLGRTKSGTLRMGVDETGLWYEYDDPGTSYSRDLLISMERGDVDQSSFQFQVEEDKWEEDEEGRFIRTLIKGKRMFDVSPVTFPAYPDTTVAKRSLEQLQQETKPDMGWQIEAEARNRSLTIKAKSI